MRLICSTGTSPAIASYATIAQCVRMKRSTALFMASGVAIGFAALPFLSAGLATFVANAAGCGINEGGAEPCLIMGLNVGPVLYNMFGAFWLFLFSWLYIPVALLLCVAAVTILVGGKRNPTRNGRVGWNFWLLFFAAMFAPFARSVSMVLAAVAFLLWWRENRVKPA
jgi:hypothetical protein